MAVGTTRGKRRLGRYLHPILTRSGRKPEEVAKLALCGRDTVYRLLAGQALPSVGRLSAILAAVDATDEERGRALRYWELANAASVTIEHAQDLPAKYHRFRLDEGEAVRVRTLDTSIVPGIMQTPDYAVAIVRAAQPLIRTPDWESRAGDERRDRQAALLRAEHPLAVHALIDEAALHRMIGGPDTMAGQFDRLLELGRRDNVTIQVIPFGVGAYGMYAGTLLLLGFADGEEDSVYVEAVTGVEPVEDSVQPLIEIWAQAAGAALSPKRSADLIRARRDTMGAA